MYEKMYHNMLKKHAKFHGEWTIGPYFLW